MFSKARIKLTTWYLLIIMLVSLSFSGVIYRTSMSEIIRLSQFQQQRLERQLQMHNFPPPPQIFLDDDVISDVRNRIILNLGIINMFILIASGVMGYFLAGRTLKPIKEMVDDQNRFVSDSSHELRTPLTSLKTSMEVALMNKKMTLDEAKQLIKENIEDVNRLQHLSDELLRLTQFEKSQSSSLNKKISIKDAIDVTVKNITPLAKKKSIKIENNSKVFYLQGNLDSLIELFTIFLDNAVKYSPNGSSVSIETKKLDGNIVTKIKDQGIGIDQKDVPHIFDRFYRADTSRASENITGYGLGLSIAKKIIDQYHGNIKVNSKINKGTEFIIKLPK